MKSKSQPASLSESVSQLKTAVVNLQAAIKLFNESKTFYTKQTKKSMNIDLGNRVLIKTGNDIIKNIYINNSF